MARAIDADELLKQQYKMGFRQMPVVSVDAIEKAPTLTPQNESLTPCDVCMYNPPSSMDGKPCCICPASPPERQEDT